MRKQICRAHSPKSDEDRACAKCHVLLEPCDCGKAKDEPNPFCRVCNGTGWKVQTISVESPA